MNINSMNIEKSAKFFLNLEKSLEIKTSVKMVEINDIEITNQKLINNEIHNFDESFFKKTTQKTPLELLRFLVKHLSLR